MRCLFDALLQQLLPNGLGRLHTAKQISSPSGRWQLWWHLASPADLPPPSTESAKETGSREAVARQLECISSASAGQTGQAVDFWISSFEFRFSVVTVVPGTPSRR